jgi:hypothetical protein
MAPESNNKMDESPELTRLLKQLRPFQREAYDFATKGIVSTRQFSSTTMLNKTRRAPVVYDPKLKGNGRVFITDEMGLGKTVTSLAIMLHYQQEWPLLILCPASLRHTWPQEIERFLPHIPPSATYIVQGFDDADFYDNEYKRKKIKIVIATYSLLQTRSAAAKVLEQFQFQCVIADESHNLKQRTSQRTQLALPLLQKAKRLVLLSGTPALARPAELWPQVYAIAPNLFGSFTAFTKQYCNARRGRFGWDISGLSNADELHSKLRQIMVRRLKADVLDELPPKQRTMVPISIPKSKRKECQALMKELSDTRQSVADLVGDEAYGANFEARKLLMQAYQCSGVAKTEGVCDYLLEWIRGSSTQKVLVFAHHKAVLDAMENTVAKELKGAGHIRIDGAVESLERASRVKKFQTCSSVRVAILSMTAAGVGLTLTAASTVMFAELHWTPGVLAQAEDRCHRIGQRNAVNIMYLVCDDSELSIDMQLWRMLGRKINNLGRIMDGVSGAGLNASKASEDAFCSGGKGGVSVQDELQSFFADNANKEMEKKRTPVKGTIQSFFAKQMSAEKDPKSKSADCGGKLASIAEKVEWDCVACTYQNSQTKSKSGCLKCEMCLTPHMEETSQVFDLTVETGNLSPAREVTPGSSRKKKPRQSQPSSKNSALCTSVETIVIDDDFDPTRSSDEKKELPTKRDNFETIVIDDDSVFVDDDSNDQLAYENQRRKKQKMVHEAAKTARKECALSFSVSKNSGRITIHYEKTGESSLTNFDVEQIVTRETADRLLEAKIDRKNAPNAKIALVYNDSIIRKGTFLALVHKL